jgi:hypothetical protein
MGKQGFVKKYFEMRLILAVAQQFLVICLRINVDAAGREGDWRHVAGKFSNELFSTFGSGEL